jgi:competence protein ComFB
MAIKNDMEFLVRKEVRRQHEQGGRGVDACWCSLCEADVTALALNQLPPRYCQEQNYGYSAAPGLGDKVRSAVTRAVEKVSRRPKHRPGRPDWLSGDPLVLNYAQKIGGDMVGSLLEQRPDACSCGQCRADALAYALNRYPPKYGVTAPGRESYQANFEDFIRHEMSQVLIQAARVVESRPHH